MNDQHLQSWRKTITTWIPSMQQQFSHLHGLPFFWFWIIIIIFLLYAWLQSNLFSPSTSIIYLQLKSNVYPKPDFEMLVSSRFWWYFLLYVDFCAHCIRCHLHTTSISSILSLGSRSVLLTLQLVLLHVAFGHVQEFWNIKMYSLILFKNKIILVMLFWCLPTVMIIFSLFML